MTELKTLKDATGCKFSRPREGLIQEGGDCRLCGTNHTFTEEWLRQEAIRWVKFYEGRVIQENQALAVVAYEAKKLVLMKFFNLTEEDLQ